LSVRNYFHPGNGHRSRGRTARDNRIIPSKLAARRALTAVRERLATGAGQAAAAAAGASLIADAMYW